MNSLVTELTLKRDNIKQIYIIPYIIILTMGVSLDI